MKIFKRIFSLTAAVLLSVPTITAPASGAEASEDGSVEVSAVSDYSVFEAIKIRRSIINQDGVYTFSDYKDVSTYLVNNSLKNIRYFTLSYDTEGADTSAYADPSVLDADTVVYKSSVRVASANLYKDGYIHYGWYFDGQIYKVGDYIKIPDCDVVFTPVWYKRCQINYYAGDYDDINGNSSAYVMSAENAQITIAESSRFSRPGYTVSGWKCSYDDKEYKPGTQYVVPGADNIDFTAVWAPAQYNINISANNGNSADKVTVKAYYNDEFVLPECDFTYDGKVFAGWKYNGVIYQPGESFTVPALLSGEKIVLVATWK